MSNDSASTDFPGLHSAHPPLSPSLVPESASAIPPVSGAEVGDVPIPADDEAYVEPHQPQKGLSYASVAKGDADVDKNVQEKGGEGIPPVTEAGKVRVEVSEQGLDKTEAVEKKSEGLSLPDVLPQLHGTLSPPKNPPPLGLAAALAPSVPHITADVEMQSEPNEMEREPQEVKAATAVEVNMGGGGILKSVDETAEKTRADVTAEGALSLASGIVGVVDKVVVGIGELVEEATGRTGNAAE
ncbi:hypothetical protein M427DRAFT_42066 [Gonapodya prolifera JEL478]|uniref:Uncharacterized protein n=1 Tax=Gonapodya prolifera (strain JEL478) TaxID=1344416 RepID=A0A139ARC2_GONPJ|nr:hypothetical protein M427DRAFT_42066 [Gonapodya prolifera JEL478]|eukprot:KXS19288.1 hypothetical protein M427DRAFT_42066 [Gonapodya prolifera JEL478]